MAASSDHVMDANDSPTVEPNEELREEDDNDDDDDDFEDALADFGHLTVNEESGELDDLGLPVFYTPVSTNYGASVVNDIHGDNYAEAAGNKLPIDGDSHHVTCQNEIGDVAYVSDEYSRAGTSATAHSSHTTREDGHDDDVTEGDDVTVQDGEDDEEEERVRRLESLWTEEEKEEKKAEASTLKSRGNEAFKAGEYLSADEYYTEALSLCPTCFTNERSVMYSNRSACKLRMGDDAAAIIDCNKALKLNPNYVKCLLRRAELHEKMDKLDEALVDFRNVFELDRSIHEAGGAMLRLEQAINERNEKMKEEMLAQLKNLGNMILKPFGLSTENFQLQQNSESGGYSVNFKR